MPLQVIGAGLGRTGTFSLKFALEYLGFGPCYHMAEIWANFPDALPKWLDVASGKADWEAVFNGYRSAVDYPACTYWRDLAALNLDARIILSTRDPDAWFDSVNTTVFSERLLGPLTRNPALKTFFEGTVTGAYGDRIGERAFMVDYFKRWNQAVMDTVPTERLLVFEAHQGWEPLCAFLDVPVPAIPYPRTNSREEMLERIAASDGSHDTHPADPDEMVAMAKAYLEQQRQMIFGTTPSA
jgi:hypothetical protein